SGLASSCLAHCRKIRNKKQNKKWARGPFTNLANRAPSPCYRPERRTIASTTKQKAPRRGFTNLTLSVNSVAQPAVFKRNSFARHAPMPHQERRYANKKAAET